MISGLHRGTQQVSDILERSRALTSNSVELTRRAGTSLLNISRSVATIESMNLQIATASEQQSAVAEEINRSVLNVREVSSRPPRPARKPPLPASSWRSWAVNCSCWWANSSFDLWVNRRSPSLDQAPEARASGALHQMEVAAALGWRRSCRVSYKISTLYCLWMPPCRSCPAKPQSGCHTLDL